jgi:WD40 repeat protein
LYYIGYMVRIIATATTVLILLVGCGKSEPTATPVPATATRIALEPTHTPLPPTATPMPPTPTASPLTATPPSDEPPAISWLSTYGDASNNVGNVVVLADDGGYFIAGATGLQFEPDPQGDIYLIRTDPAGEILWERTWGGADYEAGFAMIRASDGNLVIAGGTSSYGAGEVDMYLLKVDQNGNEIWSKTFGSTQDDEVVDVHQTQDGGYILIGYTRIAGSEGDIEAAGNIGAGESYIYLVKTDGKGNELWSEVYTGENGEQVYTTAGLPTPDGGFLVLARINPNANHNTFLLKVDADGNEAWSRAWETENLRAGNDIIPTSDGDYLIVGLSEAPDGKGSFMLMKVDPDGNELWVNVIDDRRFGYARTAIELPDRGFVALGFSGRDPLSGLEIFKVDENGQLIWTENYASRHLVHGNSILLHPEGDILITGEADAEGGMDVFLVRLEMTPSPAPPSTSVLPTEAAVLPAPATIPALDVIAVDTVGQIEHLLTLSGHRDKVYTLDFSGDDAYLASSSSDREIRLWDVRNGQLVHTFSTSVAVYNNITFSPNGSLLACADTIWDVQSRQVVQRPEWGGGAVAFSADGSLLAIAPEGQPIVLWDVASGQLVRTFDDPAENIARSLAFSPDSTLLAAGGNNNIVRLWDVASGRIAHTIQHNTEGQILDHILDLAFSPDGRVFVSGGTDDMARLWDVGSWQVIHELSIGSAPTGLAISPDGAILASSGPGLQLWDVESGKLLRTLPHSDLITVAFSPDGTLLASAGYDQQIYLWGIPR